jgi:hypothetical protein
VLDGDPVAALETVRAMLADDPRLQDLVVLVKLADRLHNARTWDYVRSDYARLKAVQTIGVLVPLAERAGLSTAAQELTARSRAAIAGLSQATVTLSATAADSAITSVAAILPQRLAGPAAADPAQRLLDRAVSMLPPEHRARYRAEWAADLHVTSGRRHRLTLAVGLLYSAHVLGREYRGPLPRPSR